MLDKATISLGISILALFLSVISYYGPQENAKERMEVHMHAVKLFSRTRPADCMDKKECESWASIVIEMGEAALKELEVERPNLSAVAYKKFYSEILLPYNEAKWMLMQKKNPGIGEDPLKAISGDEILRFNTLEYVEGKGIHK